MMPKDLAKEVRGGSIPFGGQKEVNSLARRIDGRVQVFPLASEFGVV